MFRTRDLHKNLLCDGDFCENVCSENHTLLTGINELLSTLSNFLSTWLKFDVGNVNIILLSICEFNYY